MRRWVGLMPSPSLRVRKTPSLSTCRSRAGTPRLVRRQLRMTRKCFSSRAKSKSTRISLAPIRHISSSLRLLRAWPHKA